MGNYQAKQSNKTCQTGGGAAPTQAQKKILRGVTEKYRGYLEKKSSVLDEVLYRQFDGELQEAETLIFNDEDLVDILRFLLSLYEGLDEHNIVNARVRYPGPGASFKALVEKYLD